MGAFQVFDMKHSDDEIILYPCIVCKDVDFPMLSTFDVYKCTHLLHRLKIHYFFDVTDDSLYRICYNCCELLKHIRIILRQFMTRYPGPGQPHFPWICFLCRQLPQDHSLFINDLVFRMSRLLSIYIPQEALRHVIHICGPCESFMREMMAFYSKFIPPSYFTPCYEITTVPL